MNDTDTLSSEQIKQAQVVIDAHAEKLLFQEAALLAYQAGGKFRQPKFYVDSCLYAVLSHHYQFAENVAVSLCQTDLGRKPEFLSIFAFALALNDKVEFSRKVLQQLSVLDPGKAWVNELLESDEGNILVTMSRSNTFSLEILEAFTMSQRNVVRAILQLRCPQCDREYRRQFSGSLLRFEFVPCHACLHPYIVRPREVAAKLKEAQVSYNPEELLGLDMLLWSWVHRWWQGKELPVEAVTATGDNLYEMLYFVFRYCLGETYSDILGGRSRNLRVGKDSL